MLLHPLTPLEVAALEVMLYQPLTPLEAGDSEDMKASEASDPEVIPTSESNVIIHMSIFSLEHCSPFTVLVKISTIWSLVGQYLIANLPLFTCSLM